MSIPNFPELPEGYSIEDSLSQILTSIAMEEIGLSHIINSEGEKLQYVLGTIPGTRKLNPTIEEILKINANVQDMLGTVSMNQMFLLGKMSAALNAYFKNRNETDENGGNGNCPDISKPVRVLITAAKGSLYGDAIYLPQGMTAQLSAIVITIGENNKVVWTHTDPPGVNFTAENNQATIRTTDAAVGSSLTVKAASSIDSGKYDTKTLIVIDAAVRDVVLGGDGKLYADYGDNTFREMDPNGMVTGNLICGGMDRKPGTTDDREDVVISDSGVKYLGPNADDSYQKAGPDSLLGTQDDKFVWKVDPNAPIEPCNETETPASVQVRNILIDPVSAELVRGGTQQFSATVYMSDDSVDPAGVTWELQETDPASGTSITADGLLSAGQSTAGLTVIAISKTNPAIKQLASVTVISLLQDVPTAVDGRILDHSKTGDNTDWIEIAQNGNYSLIVRKRYLTVSASHYDDPNFQCTRFGADSQYKTSDVRQKINQWFQGKAAAEADNLIPGANLRRFTVKNNALDILGIGAAGPEGESDSFSKPNEERDSNGSDVAFALSYSEAARFLSKRYAWGGGGYHQSGQIAAANFSKLQIPDESIVYDKLWLRSPGSHPNTASEISHDGSIFQMDVDGADYSYGLLYPALWVDSAIFA